MILVAACSTPGQIVTSQPVPFRTPTTTAPPTSVTPPSTSASSSTTGPDRGKLEDWELITVAVDQTELLVAVADDPGERAQGLMGVEDLGSVDGMLFVFPSDTTGFFWMKDTLIALDIAFFASDGLLVEVMTMEPCVSDPCPRYQAGMSYRWALETAAGDLALSDTARLTFPLANPYQPLSDKRYRTPVK